MKNLRKLIKSLIKEALGAQTMYPKHVNSEVNPESFPKPGKVPNVDNLEKLAADWRDRYEELSAQYEKINAQNKELEKKNKELLAQLHADLKHEEGPTTDSNAETVVPGKY
jgi:hypothetical protein